MTEGSDKETKFRTIPSALGRNFSSRSVTISIPDLIGKKTKKPIHAANIKLDSKSKNPATYREPNLDLISKLWICAI